jgi:hypothetical protein
MKKLLLPALTVMLALASCKKEGCTDSTATNFDSKANKDNGSCTYAQPVVADGFTWKENGGAAITADSAYWTTGSWGTGIRAYKGGMSNYFEVNWATQNNTSVGAKTLNASDLTFLKGSSTYNNPSTATLNVTAFSNDKLSGNFTVSVSGGSITTVEATFGNLAKK